MSEEPFGVKNESRRSSPGAYQKKDLNLLTKKLLLMKGKSSSQVNKKFLAFYKFLWLTADEELLYINRLLTMYSRIYLNLLSRTVNSWEETMTYFLLKMQTQWNFSGIRMNALFSQ